MRVRTATLPFLMAAVWAFSAPKNVVIPNAHWEPIFFGAINPLAQSAGLQPLRRADLLKGSLEIRVWVGFGLSPLEGIRLRRDGKQWSGLHAREGFGEKWPMSVKPVSPKTGWDELWKQVESLGILTLPDSSTLPDEALVLDGESYVFEISDGETYRTYRYGNPQFQKWPEAKQIIEIVKTLYAELLLKKS
jgi:hypothetical protein